LRRCRLRGQRDCGENRQGPWYDAHDTRGA
jgi:hypothetical protein